MQIVKSILQLCVYIKLVIGSSAQLKVCRDPVTNCIYIHIIVEINR